MGEGRSERAARRCADCPADVHGKFQRCAPCRARHALKMKRARRARFDQRHPNYHRDYSKQWRKDLKAAEARVR